jgi:ActR/RegA family two-component response regulator
VPLRCLIVDDSDEFVRSATRLLESQGVEVVARGSSCREALACVRTLDIDVALVDMELGDESGLAVLQELARATPAVKVVLISAWEQSELADLIADSEAVGFITKRALGADAIERLLR